MSTEKIISYDTPDQNSFAHDANEVLIDSSGATLIKLPLQGTEMYVSTAKLGVNADRAVDGNIINYPVGGAAWNEANQRYDLTGQTVGDYLSLNDDSGRDGINPLSPTSQFAFGTTGCIRIKYIPDYNNFPAVATEYIFTSGDTTVAGGLGSLLSLSHTNGANLSLTTRDISGAGTVSANFSSWLVTKDQEYEIELNFDSVANEVRLFIDGTQLGSTKTMASGPFSRDYFYFGGYYTSSFVSNYFLKDAQIFSTVQHTSNFTGEVPRVVPIYPTESKIVPSDYSVAEGFFSVAETSTLNGGLVNYVLKIETQEYWASAPGTVVVSNGTFAESNSISDWNDPLNVTAVDTLISSGAQITMAPILYSGVGADSNPLLVSTSLTYDFFAIPQSCNQCVLYGFVNDNCDNIVSGTVRVYTKKPIFTQGNTVAFDETVAIRVLDGYFELPLIIPNLPVSAFDDDLYILDMEWIDDDGDAWSLKSQKILIPNAASVLLNRDIIN